MKPGQQDHAPEQDRAEIVAQDERFVAALGRAIRSGRELDRDFGVTTTPSTDYAHRIQTHAPVADLPRIAAQASPAAPAEDRAMEKMHHKAHERAKVKLDRVSVLELKTRSCRFPHGDRTPYFFCGRVTANEEPYCAVHMLVTHRLPGEPA